MKNSRVRPLLLTKRSFCITYPYAHAILAHGEAGGKAKIGQLDFCYFHPPPQ
jgi:hypothetical protein